MVDYSKLSRNDLISLCKEKKLKGYSMKKKADLITLLQDTTLDPVQIITKDPQSSGLGQTTKKVGDKVQRLNYIGSKFQLLDWITSNIKDKTRWTSLTDKRIADLFGGTGIVSHHFRTLNASVISNDVELFSAIITKALTISIYNDKCKDIIETLNKELETGKKCGYVTKQYSPYETSERKFFTVENAQKIDYIRERIEEIRKECSEEDYAFILASLIVSADAVSNVPAVYGCYLKNFKDKATRSFQIKPIHTIIVVPDKNSKTFNLDVLSNDLIKEVEVDAVYLDPPYNERQYSKNYFPLNIIAKTPTELLLEPALKGKTGIPADCFISPFCSKKADLVEGAFDKLFKELNTKWIFLSYNSESLVSKDRMIELMEKYGTVNVVECNYKRFKSFEYNNDKDIKEYLFCLELFKE
jgi:adenine-specific DNA-methyltransferase